MITQPILILVFALASCNKALPTLNEFKDE